jgi:hypothetical protein
MDPRIAALPRPALAAPAPHRARLRALAGDLVRGPALALAFVSGAIGVLRIVAALADGAG